jgi:Ca2+-binding EF-hand superfamily protein
VFDKRGKGMITPNELKQTLQAELKIPASERDITDLVAEIDIDSTGDVNYEDFKELMNRL